MSNPSVEIIMHAVQQDGDKYVLLYEAGDEERALRAVRRWQRDPGTNFTQADADKLIRQIEEECDGPCYS